MSKKTRTRKTVELKRPGTELIVKILPYAPYFICLANFCTVIFFPSSPQFVTSVFDTGLRRWWPILVTFALLDYFLVLCLWHIYFFISGSLIAYLKLNDDLLVNMMKT